MKYKLITVIFIASLISDSVLFAAEDKGHGRSNEALSGFLVPTKEHDHEHGNKDGHRKHNEISEHADHDEQDKHSDGGIELSKAQITAAGIVIVPLHEQNITNSISAPGEVLFNAYKSKKITPRITAQIVKRHKRLGQSVSQGDVLVSLSSVEMAQAQGELIVTDREWRRVKKLGKKVVSARRYEEAQITRQQAYAKVLAFGMTKSQVDQLLKGKDPSKAVGLFHLLATQSGTITEDKFVEGEIIEPGRVLFEITDEASMWVEARLTANAIVGINPGAAANILVHDQRYTAKVTQIHHQLDETTRTIAVRLEVDNPNDTLHPGLFVEAQIQTKENQDALAFPQNAVLRSADGDWVVFVEDKPGYFKSQEVDIIRTVGDLVIVDGIAANTRVVSKGAFYVQSEIAKSGFEVHNH